MVLQAFAGLNGRAADLTPAEAMQRTRLLYKQSLQTGKESTRHGNFGKFRQLLSDLAAAKDGNRGNTPEEVTFLNVARGVSAKPELLDELLESYGSPLPGAMQTRVIRPHPLRPVHLTEDYRAAWEALLLAPPIDLYVSITKALSEIKSPASIPVLELAFAWTFDEGVNLKDNTDAVRKQVRIMECLHLFATRESLDAMLRCLHRAEITSRGQLPKSSGHDLSEWTERFLTGEHNYNVGPKWREVLRTYPKSNLPPKQRELLNRVEHFIEAQKTIDK